MPPVWRCVSRQSHLAAFERGASKRPPARVPQGPSDDVSCREMARFSKSREERHAWSGRYATEAHDPPRPGRGGPSASTWPRGSGRTPRPGRERTPGSRATTAPRSATTGRRAPRRCPRWRRWSTPAARPSGGPLASLQPVATSAGPAGQWRRRPPGIR